MTSVERGDASMPTASRTLGLVLVVLTLGLSPAFARVATIEATAPLANHSEAAIRTAEMVAIGKALEDARAKGLRLLRLERAVVEEATVTLRLLATDDDDAAAAREPAPAPPTEEVFPPAETSPR